MKKSYKFLCIFTCLVIVLSCSLFASAKMVRPYEYEWTGKELFDNVKDKRFYFNSGTQYLSTGATYAANYGVDYPIYTARIPDTLEQGKSFSIFFSFIDLPEQIQINNGDFIKYVVPTHMGNNAGYNITKVMVAFRGMGTFEDGSTGLVNFSRLFYPEYTSSTTNWHEMNVTFEDSFQWTGQNFLCDTMYVMYYGNFDSYMYSNWNFGFRRNVQLYAGSADNFPLDHSGFEEYQKDADVLHEAEDILNDATFGGRVEAEGVFKDFDALMGDDSRPYVGILAVGEMISEILGVEFISPIVYFALSLGLFSFILGTAFLLTRMVTSRGHAVGGKSYERRYKN